MNTKATAQSVSPMSGSQKLQECLDYIKASGSTGILRDRLANKWPTFHNNNLRNLIIVGAADEGVRLASICNELGIQIRAIADDSPAKQGMEIAGTRVIRVDQLDQYSKSTPVIVASHRALLPVRRIRQMGFKTVAPFMLLQVLDPTRFPPHMFHDGLLEDLMESHHQLEKLSKILADDFSAGVLSAVIMYRLECDPEVLDPITEWELYGPGDLLSYDSNEVYVDGGTFDGDSIRLFIDRVASRFDRIIGFEPDPGTFQRLKSNFIGEPRVEPINAGLHERAGTLKFDDAGTRGSILSDAGTVSVPVVALDAVLKGDRVSYIKMNIEGAEISALEGARASITSWHPKLAISAYHRPSDLWQIPFEIRAIEPKYQIYFRQHDGGIIETVCYAKYPG